VGVTTELKNYLYSSEFCKELVRRYERFEILSEGGLRTAIANLLDAKVQTLADPAAKDYRVSCEVRLKRVNVVPDILIWKGKHPRIWIELKDTKRFEAEKAKADWQKLRNYCRQYSTVRTGYLIYVARQDGDLSVRRNRETMKYRPIKIALENHFADSEAWKAWNKEYEQRAHYEPPQPKSSVTPVRPHRPVPR
jgi:hypothetical protein